MLGEREMEWSELQGLMSSVCMTTQEDEITWGLSSSKTFSTRSLYRFLTNGGIDSKLTQKIWKCKVPMKIKVFLWQIFQDRLQTVIQLKEREWKDSEHCVLCGENEDVDHLLFTCLLAAFVWIFIKEALGW
jgi:hypothetical protein